MGTPCDYVVTNSYSPIDNDADDAHMNEAEAEADQSYKLACLPAVLLACDAVTPATHPPMPETWHDAFQNRAGSIHQPHFRAIIVDYLFELRLSMGADSRCMHFTMHILDRFVALSPQLDGAELQSACIACLLIALKMDLIDDAATIVSDVLYVTGFQTEMKPLLIMEARVLACLHFNLGYLGLFPLPPDEMTAHIPRSPIVRTLTDFYMDQSLLNHQLKCVRKEVLFVACMYLAKFMYRRRRSPTILLVDDTTTCPHTHLYKYQHVVCRGITYLPAPAPAPAPAAVPQESPASRCMSTPPQSKRPTLEEFVRVPSPIRLSEISPRPDLHKQKNTHQEEVDVQMLVCHEILSPICAQQQQQQPEVCKAQSSNKRSHSHISGVEQFETTKRACCFRV